MSVIADKNELDDIFKNTTAQTLAPIPRELSSNLMCTYVYSGSNGNALR